MIDTDKYEELLENGMQHRDLWELAADFSQKSSGCVKVLRRH
jgi:hypothetical protein